MNKDNAHLYLPLVQALADGKTIQWKPDDGIWDDIDEIKFFMYDDLSCYRIKPEPRTFEMYINEKGVMYPVSDHLPATGVFKLITVQEVLK
jgi:hypothetical protein